MPLLSICIPSLVERAASLERLIHALHTQPRASDVELVIEVDNRERTTGAKRNQLVARATGEYIVHIDDDDSVSPLYLERVLTAIESLAKVDVVLVRGVREIPLEGAPRPHHVTAFDFRIRGRYTEHRDSVMDGRTFWQWPNHLCPVRSPLAKSTPFPDLTRGEDLAYKRDLFPKLRTWARANKDDEPLYFYRFNPAKGRPKTPGSIG